MKEKRGGLGPVAAGGAELLTGIGVARGKASAVCHRMFLCWSRAVRSGVNVFLKGHAYLRS